MKLSEEALALYQRRDKVIRRRPAACPIKIQNQLSTILKFLHFFLHISKICSTFAPS